jgi:peptidyl-prolyl cis-trans isomerase-like protein 2
VFDLTSIVPFIQQHKQDPTTGQPMTLKDVTKLHFHKLESGKYGCPITFKASGECVRVATD